MNLPARVGEGFHSLQLYANTFWLDHLLDYATMKGNVEAGSLCPLTKQLLRLCRLHSEYAVEEESNIDQAEVSLLDKRLTSLANWGDIYILGQRVLWNRKTLRSRQERAKGMSHELRLSRQKSRMRIPPPHNIAYLEADVCRCRKYSRLQRIRSHGANIQRSSSESPKIHVRCGAQPRRLGSLQESLWIFGLCMQVLLVRTGNDGICFGQRLRSTRVYS